MIHFTLSGHLGCFPFLTLTRDTDRNVVLCASWCVVCASLLEITPKSAVAGLSSVHMSNIRKQWQTVSQSGRVTLREFWLHHVRIS